MEQITRQAKIFGWAIGDTLVTSSRIMVVGPRDPDGVRMWDIAQGWGRRGMASAGVAPFRLHGTERLAQAAGHIVMCNHESHLDPPALIAASPQPLRFLTKESLFKWPLFGACMRAMGHIPIDRSNRDKAFASVAKAAEEIQGGKTVLIFPEGRRALEPGPIQPLKKGGFVLAVQSQAPILPVGIAGTREVLPKGARRAHDAGPVTIVVGQPVATTGYTLDTKEGLMGEVSDALSALRDRAQAWRERITSDPSAPCPPG